jgi:hypothetical protein
MTPRSRSLPCLLVLFAAAGCGSDGSHADTPGGQTESAGCSPVTRTNLAWSERSTLGFSADELLSTLGAGHQARLTYADGTSTTLTLALARTSGQVEFQDREYTSDQSGRELAIGSECPDVLSIPVTLSFTTKDGAFAEVWAVSLLANGSSTATGSVPIDLDALMGDYSVTEVDPSAFDDVVAFITLDFEGTAWSGAVSGQALESSGGSNGTSSAQNFGIGTF